MDRFPSDIAFTPVVKNIQTAKGSRAAYAKVERRRGWHKTVTPELRNFLAGLDMFYLGTANSNGQPYVQYRGEHRDSSRLSTSTRLGLQISAAINNISHLAISRRIPKHSSS